MIPEWMIFIPSTVVSAVIALVFYACGVYVGKRSEK